ncbi:hypothetical protein PAXRUDRAFT_827130 [Paxillus rubicundulus Ve08.2h10]|uniref:Uncharacterized protein n=1 Tax=Paxillus rubicundulus Ve08.2h10 TaxID=930991 RepID=A0A0D0E3A3_9AGAM|nr:hypothetical protein PAXRUDRAFT_827130 [Paxillus rubicundulus Ve08.2h10]
MMRYTPYNRLSRDSYPQREGVNPTRQAQDFHPQGFDDKFISTDVADATRWWFATSQSSDKVIT